LLSANRAESPRNTSVANAVTGPTPGWVNHVRLLPPSPWSLCNQSLLGSRESALLCNQVRTQLSHARRRRPGPQRVQTQNFPQGADLFPDLSAGYAWSQMYRSASARPQATNNSISHCKRPFSAAGRADSFCELPGIQICPHRRVSNSVALRYLTSLEASRTFSDMKT
jgi:hypothetical protein